MATRALDEFLKACQGKPSKVRFTDKPIQGLETEQKIAEKGYEFAFGEGMTREELAELLPDHTELVKIAQLKQTIALLHGENESLLDDIMTYSRKIKELNEENEWFRTALEYIRDCPKPITEFRAEQLVLRATCALKTRRSPAQQQGCDGHHSNGKCTYDPCEGTPDRKCIHEEKNESSICPRIS